MTLTHSESDHNATLPLSLILCSRNDHYMGNSVWRLETTLNYTAARLAEIDRLNQVEILVTDWGSETPLSKVVSLSPQASCIVKFVTVSPAIASALQGDSPFPEVLALNAAARRSRGQYIGRIDQDTLVGTKFLKTFFDLHESRVHSEPSLEQALIYANRRSIPYRFSVLCPPLSQVERFVSLFGSKLPIWKRHNQPFWTYWVGIWLIPRRIWDECGGYDERLIYYNWMETDMIKRLLQKYSLIDFGALTNYDFYHLEHQEAFDGKTRHSKKNRPVDLHQTPAEFNPNGEGWGLPDLDLVEARNSKTPYTTSRSLPGIGAIAFLWWLSRFSVAAAADSTIAWSMTTRDRWNHRARVLQQLVMNESPRDWPGIILGRYRGWRQRI